ncbi:MAG TPA: branched-chain amino acid ABC transporter permease [Trebonia sp.]
MPWPRRRSAGPPATSQHQYLTIVAFVVGSIAVTRLFVHGLDGFNLESEWLIFTIADLGFYLIFCIAGRFAFCQTLMMALGAYTSANVVQHHAFWIALVAGVGVAAVFALLLGMALSRTEDFLFAVGTLAVAQLSNTVFVQWTSFTGPGGLTSSVPYLSFFGTALMGGQGEIWFILACAALVLVICAFFERSPVVRELVAARELPDVTQALGIRIRPIQVAIFVVGSAFGGLAGVLFAFQQGSVSSDSFNLTLGIGLLLMPIIGGMGSMWGPVVGALLYVELPQLLSSLSRFAPLAYGIALLVIVLAFPEGLLGIVRACRRRLLSRRNVKTLGRTDAGR